MHVDSYILFIINDVCVLFLGEKRGVRCIFKRRTLLESLSEGILLAVNSMREDIVQCNIV